jgi:anti-sigma factor RsiW
MRHVLERIRFMRDHRWSPARMSDYIDAEMDAGERARMEHHVRDCPECRDLLASLQTMVATLAGLPGRPAESVAGAVLAGVHERLGTDDDRPA